MFKWLEIALPELDASLSFINSSFIWVSRNASSVLLCMLDMGVRIFPIHMCPLRVIIGVTRSAIGHNATSFLLHLLTRLLLVFEICDLVIKDIDLCRLFRLLGCFRLPVFGWSCGEPRVFLVINDDSRSLLKLGSEGIVVSVHKALRFG